MTQLLGSAAPPRQLAVSEQRLTGERDESATVAWAAARQRAPRNGANRYSHTAGWHVWVDCGHCGSSYALRPDRPRTKLDLAGAIHARWVTACNACGEDVVLWSGTRWSESVPLAEAG